MSPEAHKSQQSQNRLALGKLVEALDWLEATADPSEILWQHLLLCASPFLSHNQAISGETRAQEQPLRLTQDQKKYLKTFSKLIFHEENHFLVLFKPPGVLSQKKDQAHPSLIEFAGEYLRLHYAKPGRAFVAPVQRLDRVASGFMVLARTSKGARRLSEAWQGKWPNRFENKVHKGYWAIVTVKPPESKGSLSGAFYKEKGSSGYLSSIHSQSHKQDSAKAKTQDGRAVHNYTLDYEQITQKEGLYLLHIKILSGRFHEIRSLLGAHGLPILGDSKYGEQQLRRSPFQQIGLVASELRFPHPTSGELLSFSLDNNSDLTPERLLSTFARLR